jgi:hypothetical protein
MRSLRSGSAKPQSGYALCAVLLHHIWGRGQCFALPYYLPQTSHTTGTLSDIKPEDFQPVYHAAILGGDKEFNIFS